ncbi:MAG: transcription antitermination factor NusB [Clostridia bacterium]|nr:transcription antitermination factor NusB [Clostridia bacterium]
MNRKDARAAAMKLIYEWDLGGDGGTDTFEGLLEITPDDENFGYTQEVVRGVTGQAEALDAEISRHLVGWTLDRVSRVDLAILRLAVYELNGDEVPPGAAINEAVELAGIYSGEKSGHFVNGVLGSIYRERQKNS